MAEIDAAVRRNIYDIALARGYPPLASEIASALGSSQPEVRAALERLAAARILVLQPDSREILMSAPFSAVPTPFVVETKNYSAFANCIWDALGIPVMLRKAATIRTSCGCCGVAQSLQSDGSSIDGEGIVHFALPARHWWDDIVFT